MNTSATPSDSPKDEWFRAEICWLGPIIGAPCTRNGRRELAIATAEDPALGKSFGYVLQPVLVGADRHFHVSSPERGVERALSDRHGWFRIWAPTDLWKAPAAGVLVILLYNQSSALEYYTYDDYRHGAPQTGGPEAPAVKAVGSKKRAMKPMDPAIIKGVEAAIDKAIKKLLEDHDVEALQPGLVELSRPSSPAPDFAADAALAVAPPAIDAELVFALGSCQYPSAMLEDRVAGASYERLAKWLTKGTAPVPQCLLLVGDQIYVDGTAGLFDPTSQFDRFVRPYEIFFQMNPVREVLRRLPAFMMLDDHEMGDNWEPRVDDKRPDPAMLAGRHSYLDFQRRAGPPEQRPRGHSLRPLWYPFRVDGFPLFMADTRTERTVRTARNVESARIMSSDQMQALCDWLAGQPANVPKVVASPAILLPRHVRAIQRGAVASALRSDGWDGYPASLYEVLACIAQKRIRNVVFVSGDEHLACVAQIELEAEGGDKVIVHSVHSSPLFAPFPFANSDRADLAAVDTFDVPAPRTGGPYKCSVRTVFAPPGDGFAVLSFRRDGGGWNMECCFDRAGASGRHATRINHRLT